MKILDQLFQNLETQNVAFTGMPEELFSIYVKELNKKEKRNVLLITASLMEANKLFRKIETYMDQVYLFPMDDFLTSEALAMSPDLLITRLETLKAITKTESPVVVITNLMGYLHFIPAKKQYLKSTLTLKKGQEIEREKLIEQLANLGYSRQTLVTNTGEIGIRGFIIDVFPLAEEHPYRIEFFGDTIESIRTFDEKTQASLEQKDSLSIYPCWEYLSEKESIAEEKQKSKYLEEYTKVENITDYLKNPVVIYKDESLIKTTYEQIQKDVFEYHESKDKNFKGRYMFDYQERFIDNSISYLTLNNMPERKIKVINFKSTVPPLFHENQEAIEKYLRQELAEHKTIVICLKEYQVVSFSKKIAVPFHESTLDTIKEEAVNLVSFEMTEGFSYQNIIFLTSHELFQYNETNKKYKTNLKYGTKITDLNKLEIGDYVVHETCGIGIYNGLKTLKQQDTLRDYIEVLYQDNDKLYIPVEKISLLAKYTGKEGIAPKIYKLGGNQWEKVKKRVKAKVKDMAISLLALQAKRESEKGFAFSQDNSYQKEFEQYFPYTPTKDQLRATEEIKQDMEQPHPMDRLLIGDVGYGKTEVAFRAAFKAIMDNKQVLFLCPTTILSSQHYENALERFKEFPVQIGLLNRFTPLKERKKILEELQDGTIDMVIGTHRLLSNDVKPKDLGLLIIDEEQRFGVTHKEKIKMYKTNVDVLTLTATPIPRTLQMSIVGLRSMSLMETPPVDRYPIQTYVIEESQQIIREAIYKELSRNGQIFLLYNSVEHIQEKVREIEQLVPEARVIHAHGRMEKNEIEEKMMMFHHHEADVLVCTTIIETGIDIPNVNTLIILNADHFGLSQLYQIRGRVGRSNKIAYCYLMYQPHRILTETAVKRLKVIKEFTQLGSGFSIATRDLSIRGAGDILGKEQAGFIDSVGIDLYLKMLNEETKKLKGEKVEEQEESTQPLLNISTHISDNYVREEDLKIEIHRLINGIDSKKSLLQTKKELEDRFGKVTDDMLIYMYEEWFEKLVEKIPVTSVRQTKNSIELYFNQEVTKTIDTEQLFFDAFHITAMFRFKSRENDLTIILDTIKLEKHPIYYLTELLDKLLRTKEQNQKTEKNSSN